VRKGPVRFLISPAPRTPEAAVAAQGRQALPRFLGRSLAGCRRQAERIAHGLRGEALDLSDRIALRMKRTICCRGWLARRLARTTLITTALRIYTGLVTALGERAADSSLTMEQLYQSKAVLVIGKHLPIRIRSWGGRFAPGFVTTPRSFSWSIRGRSAGAQGDAICSGA